MSVCCKVTAYLCSPLAGDPPMLDAILENCLARCMRSVMASRGGARHRVNVERGRGVEVALADIGKIPTPIVRDELPVELRGGVVLLPIPRCSSPIVDCAREGVEHFSKQLSVENAGLLDPSERKVVATTNGRYKSYRLPLHVRTASRIVWFCVVKDKCCQNSGPREMRRRLKQVTSIGKKNSQGFGRVSRWEVERINQDYSWYALNPQGTVLMRPLPLGDCLPQDLVGFRRWFGSPCCPYWQRSLYCEIVQPC